MSFADFVSCLLACFVLLYSLVAVDRRSSTSSWKACPAGRWSRTFPAARTAPWRSCRRTKGRNADYLVSVLRAKLEQDPALAGITVEGQGDRVLLRLPPKALLSVDGAGAAGQRVVYALGGALGSLPNRIAVEVRPDRPAEFAAGLAYAVRLAQRLEDAGATGPLAAAPA